MYRMIAGSALVARGLRSRTRLAQVIISGIGAFTMIHGAQNAHGHIRQHFRRS
jgi:uncharacterized membrane protein